MRNKVVIAGGNGFLGRELAGHFAGTFDVCVLARRPEAMAHARVVAWDGKSDGEWMRELDGAAVVLNFAGRSVNCRYTTRRRREIMDSRVLSTRALGRALAACRRPPAVWLNSSTATIYRHTFGPAWDESGEIAASPEAHDAFSIEVARAWEREFFAAELPGVRRVALRTAIVLGNRPGTAFRALRFLSKAGLGGRMGDGRQWVSWIHGRDFARAVEFIVRHEELAGAVNVAAPETIANADMMRELRAAVGMPIGLPAARWMLEVGAFFMRTETELLLKSRRVMPRKLLEAGFEFEYPTFRAAAEALVRGGGHDSE